MKWNKTYHQWQLKVNMPKTYLLPPPCKNVYRLHFQMGDTQIPFKKTTSYSKVIPDWMLTFKQYTKAVAGKMSTMQPPQMHHRKPLGCRLPCHLYLYSSFVLLNCQSIIPPTQYGLTAHTLEKSIPAWMTACNWLAVQSSLPWHTSFLRCVESRLHI